MNNFLEKQHLGVISGPDGQIRLLPAKLRIPDVAFIAWESFPDGKLPRDRVCRVAPHLAVEILSEGNTKREMELKLAKYFEAGTKLVWYIDASGGRATIYTSPKNAINIDEHGVLDGFQVRLGEIFERATRGR